MCCTRSRLAATLAILLAGALGPPAAADPPNLDRDRRATISTGVEDTKKRVPKPPASPPPSTEKKKNQEEEKKKDEDESCWASCLFDALTGILTSSKDEPPAGTTALAPAAIPAAAAAIEVIGHGLIQNPDSPSVPVALWSGPGGSRLGYAAVGTLEPGTEVDVTSTRPVDNGDWVEVRTRTSQPLAGWVVTQHVDWVAAARPAAPATPSTPVTPLTPVTPSDTTAGPAPEPVAPPEPTFIAQAPEGLVLRTGIGWAYFTGPDPVREEYRDGGLQFGLEASWVARGSLQFGLHADYHHLRGYPQFDYETSTQRESPQNSRLQTVGVGLRFGQCAGILDDRARIDWGLGPAFWWLHESSDLEVFALPSGLPLGRREEVLHRWRLGADAVLGMTWQVSNRAQLGLQLRQMFIPWRGHGDKSLTLDFAGRRTLTGPSARLVLAIDVR